MIWPTVVWAVVALVTLTIVRALCLAFLATWERIARPGSVPVEADPFAPIVVPKDLVALAARETERWATDDMLEGMRARFTALGDWNLVRSAYSVGHLPEPDR